MAHADVLPTLAEWHSKQLTGTPCAGRNCAACSAAMGLYIASGGHLKFTGDQVRTISGSSCIPGAHSPSGGLFISDVERVYGHEGYVIDYGRSGGNPRRWSPTTLAVMLEAGFGGVILGDYDALPPEMQKSFTFKGDHSAFLHGYRVRSGIEQTHWHDPLATAGVWAPLPGIMRYWQKPGSAVQGLAGWVPGSGLPDTSTGDTVLETLTIAILPFGGRYVIPAGKQVTGYKFDGKTGKIAATKVWAPSPTASSASYDATVGNSAVTGNPFIRGSDGYFLGWNISSGQVDETPNPAPTTQPDPAALEAARKAGAKAAAAAVAAAAKTEAAKYG